MDHLGRPTHDRSIDPVNRGRDRQEPVDDQQELRRNADAVGRYEPTACIGGPRTDDRVPGQATLLGTPRSRSTSRTA